MSKMNVKQIEPYFNNHHEHKHVDLRAAKEEVINDYALKMKDGQKFPAILLGEFPDSVNDGNKLIIDGMHRFLAAKKAGVELDVEVRKYDNAAAALADMVVHNIKHGLRLTTGDRNKRIKLLASRGYTDTDLAKMFGLSNMSIGRIKKGEQGEGISGPKKGSQLKKFSGYAPSAFVGVLDKINKTCKGKLKGYNDFFYVQDEKTEETSKNEEAFKIVEEAINRLVALVKGLEKNNE
jgi:hypothetical protein